MDEAFSNKALSILITVSLLIAASGLFLAFKPTITGFQVATNDLETAIANVTIVSNVAITVQGFWDFGEGYVRQPAPSAILRSSGSEVSPDGYFKDDWVATVNTTNGTVRLTNDGSVNVSVRTGANSTDREWYCANNSDANTSLRINTTGGTVGQSCITSYEVLIDTNGTELTDTFGTVLCGNDSLAISETVNPHLEIVIDEICPANNVNHYLTVSFFAWNNVSGP